MGAGMMQRHLERLTWELGLSDDQRTQVQTLVQAIAAKEADLRLSHITVMQEIRKLLNPEQQKTFRTMQSHMMEDGGVMGHGSMMGSGEMMGGMMGRRGMMGHGSKTR